MNSKKRVLTVLVASLVAVLSGTARAEETLNPVETHETRVSIIVKDKYTIESDASSMPGEVSVNRSDLQLEYAYKAFDVLPLTFGISHRHVDIKANTPVSLPSDLEGLQFIVGAKFPMPFVESDVYFMGFDLMPSMYTDDFNWENSAFRLPFRIYGIYKPVNDDNFLFVLGATINVNADNPVTPIIGFNYRPDDRWNIHLATSEPTVSYKLTENLAVFGEYGAILDEYEVTRANQSGVVLKVREASFGGGFKYLIEEWLDASLSTGATMGRRFQYRDGVGKVDVDGAPYIKARLSFKF